MVLLGFVDDPVLSGSPVNGGWNINYQNLVIIRIPPAGGA